MELNGLERSRPSAPHLADREVHETSYRAVVSAVKTSWTQVIGGGYEPNMGPPRQPTRWYGKLSHGMALKLTGAIWQEPPRVRAQIVRRVCERLKQTHGTPRLGNPNDPLDDLVFIILSNKTTPKLAETTYQTLKSEFRTWEELRLGCTYSKLTSLIRRAGLGRVKAAQLLGLLNKLAADFGSCTLAPLRSLSEDAALRYLTSLPGVSDKVARCVLMYSLEGKVLPVDAHVHRIARRLGWTARRRSDQCHEELEVLLPPDRRFAFHVDCVLHGRATCRPSNPVCEACSISRYCTYYRSRLDGLQT